MADSGTSSSWWGGWLQTAKEKSSSALDFMKRDLAEFTSVMQKDTTVAAGAVKEKINQETASVATKRMKDGVSSLLGGISKALVIEPEDKNYRGEPITSDSHIFDRAKARLHAIQLDPGTYCSEPSGSKEEFDAWLSTFELEDQKGAISELLVSNVQVRSLYTQLVPSEVSHADFWQRYFYKVYQLEQDEARKAALKRRADVGAQEAELEWDDDEWGDLEVGSQASPTTTSTSSTGEWTRVDTTPRDIAGNYEQSRIPEVQSTSSVDSDKSDSLKTDSPSPAESTQKPISGETKSEVDKEVLQDSATQRVESKEEKETADKERTLSKPVEHGVDEEQQKSQHSQQKQQSVPLDADRAEPTATTSFNESNTKEEAKGLAVPMKDKGDLVLVGSERNTPSSDSSNSKEVSSLDEDWEKDFDIEVSEEDIRLAQEAARKLADEGATGIGDDDDDDWENWD